MSADLKQSAQRANLFMDLTLLMSFCSQAIFVFKVCLFRRRRRMRGTRRMTADRSNAGTGADQRLERSAGEALMSWDFHELSGKMTVKMVLPLVTHGSDQRVVLSDKNTTNVG